MKVKVNIKLKDGVLDPQGKTIMHALKSLGFKGIHDVKVAKQIILDVDDDKEVKQMCEDLLANTVIENYEILS